MNKNRLLAALAAVTVTLGLPSVQAQNEQVPRDQRLGRAVPAAGFLNREVATQAGKKVGEIEDVIFDLESGRVLYVALNPQGGAQGDMVAVPPRLFALPAQRAATAQARRPLVIRATEQALAGAPKFGGTGEQLAQGAYADKVYGHFNQPKWWTGASGDSKAGQFNHIRRASQAKKFAVENSSNVKLGQVETVLFDVPAGRVSYVILDPAASIANREELIPIPPMAFTRGQGNQTLVLGLDKEKLNNAPRINREALNAEDIQRLSNSAFATQVYNYYGKEPWFQNENIPTPTGLDQGNRQNNN